MKRLALAPNVIPRARRLRREMTPQERKIWRGLRESFPDAHFRKQVPIGTYIADFAWHSAKLIIEVDGSQHGSEAGLAHDKKRTAFLESEGYQVLRFWNSDVDQNLNGVLAMIAVAIRSVEENIGAPTCAAPTLPSPQGGGVIGVR
jgi:very-short-patch-repair endonuclease